MKDILEVELEGETPSSRLKQLGLMAMIYQMRLMNIETTVNNIMEISGLSRSTVFESAMPLVERKLLVEDRVLNTGGRGRAARFLIAESLLAQAPFRSKVEKLTKQSDKPAG